MLWLPGAVDLFILPRTALVVAFGAVMLGLGLPGPRGLRLPLLAVAAAAVLAAGFSINPWLSIAGAYTRYESVVVRLAYVGLFIGSAVLCRRPGSRELALRFLLAGCAVAGLEALWQGYRHELARPDGNLGQPGLLGALLAMAVPVGLQVGLRDVRWLVALIPVGGGLYVSSSRAGWLGALVGLLVFGLLVAPRRWRRRALLAATGIIVVAGLVVLLSPLRNLNQDTGGARVGVWSDSVRMIAARPLTGWGEDATGLMFGHFQTHDWEPGDTFDRIHDQPLDLLVAQGLLGGAAMAWLLVAFARGALRRPWPGALAACAAYLAWSLLNFDWAPATGAVWALAGLAWGYADDAPTPDPPRWGGGLVGLLVGLLLAVPPVLADVAYHSGDLKRAVALNPLQARYHQALGEQLGSTTPQALAELRRARDLGDYDYSFLIELGDAERKDGHVAEARRAYQAALDVYPFDPTAPQRLKDLGYSSSSS
ncbi:MAG TPA: O-antigen ligase family protein [Candidatus Dormibacteraeota bacterium]